MVYQYVMPDILFGNPSIEIHDCGFGMFVGPGASDLDFGQAVDAAALLSTCSTTRQELMFWVLTKVLFKINDIPLNGPPNTLGFTELARSLIRVISFRQSRLDERPLLVRDIVAKFTNLEYIKVEDCYHQGHMIVDGSIWCPRFLVALQGIRTNLMPTADYYWEPLKLHVVVYLLPKGYRNDDLRTLDIDGEVTRFTQTMLWRRARGDPGVFQDVHEALRDNLVLNDFP
jgi:hypothetical protein